MPAGNSLINATLRQYFILNIKITYRKGSRDQIHLIELVEEREDPN